MSLENRTAVISGASSGLGAVLVRELAAQKVNLVLLERSPDKLAGLLEELKLAEDRLLVRQVDLLDPAAVRGAVEAAGGHFGRLDILLHLVGGWTGGKTLVETPAAELDGMLKQHVWTSFNILQAVVPQMVRNGWGRVIMITSPTAVNPGAKSSAYAAGKAGQDAMMMALAQELKGSGVTANLLQVKTIDVKGEKKAAPAAENAGWTTPEEMSGAVMYLLSEPGGVVNGVRLALTDGYR